MEAPFLWSASHSALAVQWEHTLDGSLARVRQNALDSKRPLVNAWTTFTVFQYQVCSVLAMGTLEKLHNVSEPHA